MLCWHSQHKPVPEVDRPGGGRAGAQGPLTFRELQTESVSRWIPVFYPEPHPSRLCGLLAALGLSEGPPGPLV